MFKMYKHPYQSPRHDRINSKYGHCHPSAEKWNYKIIPLLWIKSPSVDRFWCLRQVWFGSFDSGSHLGFLKVHVSCLKSYQIKIWNSSILPTNLLQQPILTPFRVGLAWQIYLLQPSRIVKCSYLKCFKRYKVEIQNSSYTTSKTITETLSLTMVAILDFSKRLSQLGLF